MKLFIAQDYYGNITVTDDRDSLGPDITDFNEIDLPKKAPHARVVGNHELWLMVQGEEICQTINREEEPWT